MDQGVFNVRYLDVKYLVFCFDHDGIKRGKAAVGRCLRIDEKLIRREITIIQVSFFAIVREFAAHMAENKRAKWRC